MKNLSFTVNAFILLLIVFSSCSPTVTTQIFKRYPALDQDAPVALFEFGDEVPDSVETIAMVKVKDGNSSTQNKYPKIVALAQAEARKIGGNGLHITEYLPAQRYGTSYDQIVSTVLRLNPSYTSDHFTVTDYNREQEVTQRDIREIFPYELSLNIGYGYIINKGSALNQADKELEDKLRHGLSWDAKLNRYYGRGLGWGLVYSGFASTAKHSVSDDDNHVLLTYIGPTFVGKTSFGKIELKSEAGIGYFRYWQKAGGSVTGATVTGNTIGSHVAVGLNYKTSQTSAIGFEVSYFGGGTFDELNVKGNAGGSSTKVSLDEKMGASKLSFTIGFRHFFGKRK